MSPRRFTTSVTVPLKDEGFPSVEERLETTPAAYTVKGMYFADLEKALRSDWARITPRLIDPPKDGRYVPFRSYPMKDHALLAYEAAKKQYPSLSMRESLRRLHRGNMETFLGSTIGSVIKALISNIKDGYLRCPDAFAQSRSGGTVVARSIEERAVELVFANSNPWIDCSDLGTLEGLGLHYGVQVRIEVDLSGPCDGSFLVRWH